MPVFGLDLLHVITQHRNTNKLFFGKVYANAYDPATCI